MSMNALLLMEFNVFGELSIKNSYNSRGCNVCASFITYETCIENKGLCLWN